MADPVTQAKKDLHHATDERQNRIQNWWNQQINEGRAIQESRVQQQPVEQQTQRQNATEAPQSAPFSAARDDPPKRPRGRPRKPINEPSAGRDKSLKNA